MEEMRTFGYLCPACGKPVMAARSLFALEASGVEVECECGGSALRTEFDGQKCRIFVPCGLCGETHMAQCSPEQLARREGVAFGCVFPGEEELAHQANEYISLESLKKNVRIIARAIVKLAGE